MPPRVVTASIVSFWLFTLGWFAYREWLPWLRADSPPPFTVDLVDEAAPLTAQWSIWRGEQKIGNLATRMTVQKDDSFELYSSIENFKLTMPLFRIEVGIEVPKLTTVQKVTREGRLLAVNSSIQSVLTAFGLREEIKARLEGTVRDGKLVARVRLESAQFGLLEQELEPIELASGSMLNPMQPVAKLHVRPGQQWRITHVDPLGEAMIGALRQLAKRQGLSLSAKLMSAAPKEVLVKVLAEPQNLAHGEMSIPCYVIEYHSDDISGRTLAQVSDGKVLLQEVSNWSDRFILRRED